MTTPNALKKEQHAGKRDASTLERRFGQLGLRLFEALPAFSSDLVALVATFSVSDIAFEHAVPELLQTVGRGRNKGEINKTCTCVGCAPDGFVWVGDRSKVQDGKLITRADTRQMQRAVAIAFTDREAIIAMTQPNSAVVVCNLDGSFVRAYRMNVPEALTGCAVDPETHRVFVSDWLGRRIMVFGLRDSYSFRFPVPWLDSGAGSDCGCHQPEPFA